MGPEQQPHHWIRQFMVAVLNALRGRGRDRRRMSRGTAIALLTLTAAALTLAGAGLGVFEKVWHSAPPGVTERKIVPPPPPPPPPPRPPKVVPNVLGESDWHDVLGVPCYECSRPPIVEIAAHHQQPIQREDVDVYWGKTRLYPHAKCLEKAAAGVSYRGAGTRWLATTLLTARAVEAQSPGGGVHEITGLGPHGLYSCRATVQCGSGPPGRAPLLWINYYHRAVFACEGDLARYVRSPTSDDVRVGPGGLEFVSARKDGLKVATLRQPFDFKRDFEIRGTFTVAGTTKDQPTLDVGLCVWNADDREMASLLAVLIADGKPSIHAIKIWPEGATRMPHQRSKPFDLCPIYPDGVTPYHFLVRIVASGEAFDRCDLYLARYGQSVLNPWPPILRAHVRADVPRGLLKAPQRPTYVQLRVRGKCTLSISEIIVREMHPDPRSPKHPGGGMGR